MIIYILYGSLAFTISCIITLISLKIFFNYIRAPYIKKIRVLPFEELLNILNTFINLEIKLYDENVFKKTYSLTNANFENYYRDLMAKIDSHISDGFKEQFGLYINERALVEIVARAVRNFLSEKIR